MIPLASYEWKLYCTLINCPIFGKLMFSFRKCFRICRTVFLCFRVCRKFSVLTLRQSIQFVSPLSWWALLSVLGCVVSKHNFFTHCARVKVIIIEDNLTERITGFRPSASFTALKRCIFNGCVVERKPLITGFVHTSILCGMFVCDRYIILSATWVTYISFCLCSEQARPVLWEEEDQIHLTEQQNVWTT